MWPALSLSSAWETPRAPTGRQDNDNGMLLLQMQQQNGRLVDELAICVSALDALLAQGDDDASSDTRHSAQPSRSRARGDDNSHTNSSSSSSTVHAASSRDDRGHHVQPPGNKTHRSIWNSTNTHLVVQMLRKLGKLERHVLESLTAATKDTLDGITDTAQLIDSTGGGMQRVLHQQLIHRRRGRLELGLNDRGSMDAASHQLTDISATRDPFGCSVWLDASVGGSQFPHGLAVKPPGYRTASAKTEKRDSNVRDMSPSELEHLRWENRQLRQQVATLRGERDAALAAIKRSATARIEERSTAAVATMQRPRT